MTHRIDDYLDGTLDRIALTPAERAQADILDRVIDDTRAFVDARPAPDLSSRVMQSIAHVDRAVHHPSLVKRLAWMIWDRREVSFQFRPAYAVLTAAALFVLALLVPGIRVDRTNTASQARVTDGSRLLVQFRLQAADAATVRLAGSFTNWQPEYELHQTSPGIWTITLPLPLGVHDYAFVIDGQRWVADPYAQAVDDGFGGTNSRIAILAPSQSRS
jgi:Glycogen recognition site of AMP-activated protein kinase